MKQPGQRHAERAVQRVLATDTDPMHVGKVGLDFVVVENTLGKWGSRVEELNAVPRDAQVLVGSGI